MPCATCGAKAAIQHSAIQRVQTTNYLQNSQEPCEYSVEMLRDFEEKLVWFKNNGLYLKHNIAPVTMNKYIGIVLTSLNIHNRCMYRNILDKISDVCDLITTLQNV